MAIDLKVFLNKESFSQQIEQMVRDDGFTYFDAIIEFANECDKEPDEMLGFMSQVLLEKVRKSATDSGLIDLKETNLDEFLE